MDTQIISEFLKSLRKAKGYTQQQVADLLYISPKTVSKWESGDGIPDISLISAVADIYDVTVDEILRGKKGLDKQTKTTMSQHKKIATAVKVRMIKRINNFIYIGLALHVILLITAMIVIGTTGHIFLGSIIWVFGVVGQLIIVYFGYKDYKNSIQFEEEASILEAHKDVKLHIQKNAYIGILIGAISLCVLGIFLWLSINSTLSIIPFLCVIAILYPVIVLWKYIHETEKEVKQQILKNMVFILNSYFIFLIASFGLNFHISDQFSWGFYPLYVSTALPYIAPNIFRSVFLISMLVYILYIIVSYISIKFRKLLPLMGILLIVSASLIHFDLVKINHTSYYGFIPSFNIILGVLGLIVFKIFSSKKINRDLRK